MHSAVWVDGIGGIIQKQELAVLLEECEKEAEELDNLVRTRMRSLKTSRGGS